jgi:hypothetical protein
MLDAHLHSAKFFPAAERVPPCLANMASRAKAHAKRLQQEINSHPLANFDGIELSDAHKPE